MNKPAIYAAVAKAWHVHLSEFLAWDKHRRDQAVAHWPHGMTDE